MKVADMTVQMLGHGARMEALEWWAMPLPDFCGWYLRVDDHHWRPTATSIQVEQEQNRAN